MLRILIVLSVVFGVVLCDPIAIRNSRSPDASALDFLEERTVSDDAILQLLPSKVQLFFDVLKAVVGVKVSVMSLAVSAIGWLVSNGVVVVVGALAALGLCKLTGKCTLNYEDYVPVAQLRSFATPEYLEPAQKFLLTAVEKYAETRAKRI